MWDRVTAIVRLFDWRFFTAATAFVLAFGVLAGALALRTQIDAQHSASLRATSRINQLVGTNRRLVKEVSNLREQQGRDNANLEALVRQVENLGGKAVVAKPTTATKPRSTSRSASSSSATTVPSTNPGTTVPGSPTTTTTTKSQPVVSVCIPRVLC